MHRVSPGEGALLERSNAHYTWRQHIDRNTTAATCIVPRKLRQPARCSKVAHLGMAELLTLCGAALSSSVTDCGTLIRQTRAAMRITGSISCRRRHSFRLYSCLLPFTSRRIFRSGRKRVHSSARQ